MLYSRVFGARTGAEKVETADPGFGMRIRNKDRYIKETIKAAKREGADSDNKA